MRFYISTVFFLISFISFGQNNPKIPLLLSEQMHSRSDERISILVEGNSEVVRSFCEDQGANFKYAYDNVSSIELKYSDLVELAWLDEIEKIEANLSRIQPLMDSALIKNNIDGVHDGISPLPGKYTGKDVIVGIIDFGIYFNHYDFRKADSTTRIRYIWDQTVSSSPRAPLGYGYGAEWSWIDIDSGNCTHNEGTAYFGHGTNVAGIAAGNGRSNEKYKGVAPNSELIIVSLDGNTLMPNIVDAIDYIFKKADALAKPCVINTSVGIYSGSHDGKDLYSRMIEEMIEEQSGRAVVAAVGNAGNFPLHLGYDVEEDSAFTWFFENNPSKPIYFEVYSDTADLIDVYFSVGADNPSLFFSYGKTPWLNVKRDFEVSVGSPDLNVQSIYYQGFLIGQVWCRIEEAEGVYKVELQVFPVINSLYWRFSTKGEGRIDVWSNKTYTGSSNMIIGGLPSPIQMPEIVNYKLPDFEQNMVSSWQCSPKVITVGNYVNRTVYTDFNSNLHDVNSEGGAIPSVSNDLYPTSSYGPARSGIVKPDVAATGSATLCAGNVPYINLLIGSGQGYKVAEGGLHNRNGGTSMASPIVAGIAALYLEKNPNASWNEIKGAIISSAREDNFTGSTPNPGWGYGKVDAMAALSFEAFYGCTDATAFNYDPAANVDNGSCIPVIYGCTDSTAINYEESANTDDGSCEYNTGIEDLLDEKFIIYPNPASGKIKVSESEAFENFSILNGAGMEIMSMGLTGTREIDISMLEAGVYILKMEFADGKLEFGKFVKVD